MNWIKKILFMAFITVPWLAQGMIQEMTQGPCLLTDPMLQNPTPQTIDVVWFTEFEGQSHYVEYGEDLTQKALCRTKKLSRLREEGPQGPVYRSIYRHEATLSDLPSSRTPYRVVSVASDGELIKSGIFSCAPAPKPGMPLKILFTSDHQVKPMVAANLQKVKEAIPDIDAIFYAGDCVDHPDRASEWFDEPSGGSFFACLQGKAKRKLGSVVYTGGSLLQYAPMFCAIGNHELMGRWSMEHSLDEQFNDTYPKQAAEKQYRELFPNHRDPFHQQMWIKDHSFNADSYEEIFTLPRSPSGGQKYYAVTLGDIRLVVLHATRIWRKPTLGVKGKYSEDPKDFEDPSRWGYGDFIFEPIEKGSSQYQWLEQELQGEEFQKAKYKMVMLHNPLHSLGENAIPAFSNAIQTIESDKEGKITKIGYHYPKDGDILIRDLEPLLTHYGVQLVLCGHTHVWNRFQSEAGIHHLETSNVGNSYGAYLESKRSLTPGKADRDYAASGDPNGLSPILPTLAPLRDSQGKPLPYISSNEITVFSVFSTDIGAIDSYYFDTTKPESEVVHFDRFFLQGFFHPAASITAVQEYAQKYGLPKLVVFDIDNTLIESSRQIALDPSTNGFLRKKFPHNSEEIIQAIQSQVAWKLCEPMTSEVVKFFQEKNVKIIGVTKRSPSMKEKVHLQLKENGINLSGITAEDSLEIEGGVYYKGVLYAQSDKGTALKALFQKIQFAWQGQTIYVIDDRKSHLLDFQKQFANKAGMTAFEYTYSHKQQVDEHILESQLHDFLANQEIKEDSFYKQPLNHLAQPIKTQ
jgi:hypothetical protein